MNTNLLNIVKQIIVDNGESILDDPQRLKGLFSDLAKDEPKSLRIAFGRCMESGAYTALKTAPDVNERILRKTEMSQRVRDEHGLDITLCSEALDILESSLYGMTQMSQQQAVSPTSQLSNNTPKTSLENQHDDFSIDDVVAPLTLTRPNHTLRNILIVASIVLVIIGLCLFFVRTYHSLKLDDNNLIIFYKTKNNDQLITANLGLSLKNVKATQEFIRKNFPDFDFEEGSYITDDYRNELLVKDFNDDPQVLYIYLNGIKEMAGLSQTYARLFMRDLDDDKLVDFCFGIDQEFSDTSGFEYNSDFVFSTGWEKNEILGIILYKYLYSDTNEPYWEIEWHSSVPVENRLALLRGFLNSLRYTKVFQNLGRDFFRDIFTGIEQYQTIEDIVDWWE